jgi:hypothetical protein
MSKDVRENRLRRMADRQGLVLQRSRRRDPWALGFGTYQLIGKDGRNSVMDGGTDRGYGRSLDEIEGYLTRELTC